MGATFLDDTNKYHSQRESSTSISCEPTRTCAHKYQELQQIIWAKDIFMVHLLEALT